MIDFPDVGFGGNRIPQISGCDPCGVMAGADTISCEFHDRDM
jgi:hypothetical protein